MLSIIRSDLGRNFPALGHAAYSPCPYAVAGLAMGYVMVLSRLPAV